MKVAPDVASAALSAPNLTACHPFAGFHAGFSPPTPLHLARLGSRGRFRSGLGRVRLQVGSSTGQLFHHCAAVMAHAYSRLRDLH
jgi:hypothetical protein